MVKIMVKVAMLVLLMKVMMMKVMMEMIDDESDDGDGEDDGVPCSRLIHPLQLPRCIRQPPFWTKPTWYWERYGSLTWPPTTVENFDQTSHVHKLFLLQPAKLSVQEISPKYDQRLLNLFENRWHLLKSRLSQT